MPQDLDLTHPIVSSDVSEFIDYLIDTHAVGNAASLSYFLEKPWKYQDEYNRFRRAQTARVGTDGTEGTGS